MAALGWLLQAASSSCWLLARACGSLQRRQQSRAAHAQRRKCLFIAVFLQSPCLHACRCLPCTYTRALSLSLHRAPPLHCKEAPNKDNLRSLHLASVVPPPRVRFGALAATPRLPRRSNRSTKWCWGPLNGSGQGAAAGGWARGGWMELLQGQTRSKRCARPRRCKQSRRRAMQHANDQALNQLHARCRAS